MASLTDGSGENVKLQARYVSPLRYPGGKRKLTSFLKLVLRSNNLLDGDYVEPYAGGASIAIALLYDEYARRVHINDLDYSIYAFWYSVLHETERLCRLINDKSVTMDEWHRQNLIQQDTDSTLVERGFSTFFLNRTNRSGIITGGVIGGKRQSGEWKLDARYNKADLIMRIERIARYKDFIHLYNIDASDFMRNVLPTLSSPALVYLDPPYFVAGKQLLYTNFYEPKDHKSVARLVRKIKPPWIVSYDDVPEIRSLYDGFRYCTYTVHYSAQNRYCGSEIMFFSSKLNIPNVTDPARVKSCELERYLIPS